MVEVAFSLNCEREKRKNVKQSISIFNHYYLKFYKMKNSINSLKNNLKSGETLGKQQLLNIKGGVGEDLRRTASTTTTTVASAIAKLGI